MNQSASHVQLSRRANDASLALDIVRLLAAQAVCVGHAISFFSVLPAMRTDRVPFMQNLGVIVFFWLSGFLIAHVLVSHTQHPQYTFKSYVLDRFARIYSAYLPALLLIYGIDAWLLSRGRYDFSAYHGPGILLGNILMLQNYRGQYPPHLAVPSLGSGGPLWTLSVEFHIYLFVGSLFFLARARPWATRIVLGLTAILTSAVPVHYLAGGLEANVGTGLFLLWLAGFACYFVARHGLSDVPLWLAGVGGLGLLGLYASSVQRTREYAPAEYVILAAGLLLLVSLVLRTHLTVAASAVQRGVRLLADSSYSLYLLHYTILYAMVKTWHGDAMAGALLAVALANTVALAFASVTEFHHKRLARWLRSWLDAKSVRPVPSSP